MQVTYESPCQDQDTGQDGYCVVSVAVMTGDTYVMFIVGEELQSIRRIIDGGYETIWQATPGELM